MSHCVLHAGLPKTATTMLQDHLFARHTGVDYLGTYHHRSKKQWNKCRDAQVEALLDELVFRRARRPNLSRAHQLYKESVQPSLDAGRVPVWSWESLSLSRQGLRTARARNLRTVLGPCKVVMVLRNPLQLVESVYFQHLKRENVGGKYKRFRRPWLHTIESWLEQSWPVAGAPLQHLDYARTVDIFVDTFGRENVALFLFEDLVSDPEAFIRNLSTFVGIEPEQSVALTRESRSNDRWTQAHLEAVHRIRSSRIQRAAFQLATKQGRLQMIGLKRAVGTADGARARAPIPTHWQHQIETTTAAGNQRLAAEWNLALSHHGYPLPSDPSNASLVQ